MATFEVVVSYNYTRNNSLCLENNACTVILNLPCFSTAIAASLYKSQDDRCNSKKCYQTRWEAISSYHPKTAHDFYRNMDHLVRLDLIALVCEYSDLNQPFPKHEDSYSYFCTRFYTQLGRGIVIVTIL